ncbi:hypothetical protein INR49_028812 [Caranx melampygus]|nr:hypothetical protein INR49_028812 [Caranx melampygus]
MRRHRVFLLCTVGLCVISFLHYYKALHYVSLLHELSPPNPNIKSFIMVTGFFWREKGVAATPLSPASPKKPLPSPVSANQTPKLEVCRAQQEVEGMEKVEVKEEEEEEEEEEGGWPPGFSRLWLEIRLREEPVAPDPGEKPEENQRGDSLNEERAEDHLMPGNSSHQAQPAEPDPPEGDPLNGKEHRVLFLNKQLADPLEAMGDLHTRTYSFRMIKHLTLSEPKPELFAFGRGRKLQPRRSTLGNRGEPQPMELGKELGRGLLGNGNLYKSNSSPPWHRKPRRGPGAMGSG